MANYNGPERRQCKPAKDSRTLRFNKRVSLMSSITAGVMTLSDSFGFMKADWTCIALFIAAVVGISGYNYWLRLHTSEPVEW